jgi:CRP-like cAMP-binding protein
MEAGAGSRALSGEARQALLDVAQELEVPPGKELTSEGEFGYSFFLIEEGNCSVEQDGRSLGTLGPGDFFGEVALLVTAKRSACVTADTPMRVRAVFDQDFRRVLREHPDLEGTVRGALAERFQKQPE